MRSSNRFTNQGYERNNCEKASCSCHRNRNRAAFSVAAQDRGRFDHTGIPGGPGGTAQTSADAIARRVEFLTTLLTLNQSGVTGDDDIHECGRDRGHTANESLDCTHVAARCSGGEQRRSNRPGLDTNRNINRSDHGGSEQSGSCVLRSSRRSSVLGTTQSATALAQVAGTKPSGAPPGMPNACRHPCRRCSRSGRLVFRAGGFMIAIL
jgi:hypothetical protein